VESTEQRLVVTAIVTKADLTAALTAWPWLHLVRLRRAVLLVAVLFGTVALVDVVLGVRVLGARLVVALAVLYVVLVMGAPWIIGRRVQEAAGIGARSTWVFDPVGLTWTTPKTENQVFWGRVSHVRRTDRVVAFLLKPQYVTVAVPAAALDDAGLARVTSWWQAARSQAAPVAPGSTAAGPTAAEPDGWGGPAWTDEVVVRAPMTLSLVRAMNRFVVPRRARVLPLAAVALWVAPPLVQLVVAPDLFDAGQGRMLAVGVLVALVVLGMRELSFRRVARRLSGGDTEFRVTPQGLSMHTPLGRTTVPWSRVESAREDGGSLVLRTDAPRCPIGIPTGGLASSEHEQLRGWLASGTQGRVTVPPRTRAASGG
jgi:hypothetical protein